MTIPKDYVRSSAESTTPSVVGDGVDVRLWLDQYGRPVVKNDFTIIDVTPTLDAGTAYADEDILFDTTVVSNAVLQNGASVLESLIVVDKDDNGAAFDIYFTDNNAAIANANAAEAATDAELSGVLTKVSVAAGDYVDLANGQIVVKSATAGDAGMGAILQPATSTDTSVWIFGVSQGTPTFTNADDLILRIGLRKL